MLLLPVRDPSNFTIYSPKRQMSIADDRVPVAASRVDAWAAAN